MATGAPTAKVRSRAGFVPIATGVLLGLACGTEEAVSPAREPEAIGAPAEDAVAREFEGVCRRLRAGDEPYYGGRAIQELSAWLRSPQARDATPLQRERRRLSLAAKLVQMGLTETGLEVLEEGEPDLVAASLAVPAAPDGPNVENTSGLPRPEQRGPRDDGSVTDPDLRVRRLALERDANLQLGEDRNCVLAHSPTSCILPFRDDAIHVQPGPARRAAELSLSILELRPDSVSARWILNIARMVTDDYPEGVPEALRMPEDAFRDETDFPHWPNRAPELGVDRVDVSGGAIMDDFDGDGLLDLVSSTADPCDSVKAFRNDGRGGFEDVTEAWGLSSQLGGLNLVHADYDGDGRLDLLVLRGGWLGMHGRIRNSLLRNELGSGPDRFVDVTREAGLADPYPTQTAAFADFDGDGDLDLYVGNEAWVLGVDPASQLFRNEGDGRFRDVAAAAGVENHRFAKGVAWGDADDDGDPDLYVSNLGANRLYRNDGDGTFTDVAPELGVTGPERSFAAWFFDYDNDGRLDLFVADYGATGADVMASYLGANAKGHHPLLYRNTGAGFEEVSARLGLTRPSLPMGANHGDLDSDGWPDLYLGTGDLRFDTLIPNMMLRNRRGEAFEDVTFAGGFGHLQKGHGVAFGDIDQDGDQDLFHQLGGFFPGDAYGNALFENPGPDASWITLRLEGTRANRFGVGARIAVRIREPEGSRTVHALAGSGGSFGGSSLQQEIGLGRARAIEWIEIRWPGSGTRQRFEDVAPNRVVRVVEGDRELHEVAAPSFALGSSGRGAPHRHAEHEGR